MDYTSKNRKYFNISTYFLTLFALLMSPLSIISLQTYTYAYAQNIETPSVESSPSAFIGMWENPNAQGISKADVRQLEGGELQVNLWGACMPNYCDWGIANATHVDGMIKTDYDFPFKTSNVTLSSTSDGKLKVQVKNDFDDNTTGRSERSDIYDSVDILSRPSDLSSTSKEPILGVPYPITLSNNGTTGYDIEYRLNLSFVGEDNKYNISSIDKGSFDSYNVLDKNTVVFYTRTLAENQNRSGLVVFQFEDGLGEKHRQLTVDANLTSTPKSYYNNDLVGEHSPPSPSNFSSPTNNLNNETSGIVGRLTPGGQVPYTEEAPPTPSGSISFTVDASFFEVLVSVTKVGDDVFKLAWNIYDKVTPCVAMGVNDEDNDTNNPVIYKVDMTNCSAHPEKVIMSLAPPSGEQISQIWHKKLFDLAANTSDSSILEVIVPANMTDNIYPFTVNADVLMNVFGREFIVAKSISEESFRVKRPLVQP